MRFFADDSSAICQCLDRGDDVATDGASGDGPLLNDAIRYRYVLRRYVRQRRNLAARRHISRLRGGILADRAHRET